MHWFRRLAPQLTVSLPFLPSTRAQPQMTPPVPTPKHGDLTRNHSIYPGVTCDRHIYTFPGVRTGEPVLHQLHPLGEPIDLYRTAITVVIPVERDMSSIPTPGNQTS